MIVGLPAFRDQTSTRNMDAAIARNHAGHGDGPAGGTRHSDTLRVESGGVYALKVLVLGETGAPTQRETSLECEFFDSAGIVITPEYDRLDVAEPDARTVSVEVYPRRLQPIFDATGYSATRLLVAPPGAVALKLATRSDRQFDVRRIELERLALKGPGPSAIKTSVLEVARSNVERLRAALREAGEDLSIDPLRSLEKQLEGLRAAASGWVWNPVRKRVNVAHVMGLIEKRRGAAARGAVFAFIGTERLYHKLSSHGQVVLVKEETPFESLDLVPDALVIEASVEAILNSWQQQLCGPDGAMTEAAAGVLGHAQVLNVPVIVFAPARRDELALYRRLLAAADHILIEGLEDGALPDWLPGTKVTGVPRTFERTVAAPVIDRSDAGFRLTIPNSAPILVNSEHASLVGALDSRNLLLAEALADMSETEIANLLAFSKSILVGPCGHVELLYYLQHSDVVLLFMDSRGRDEELQDLVIDATACGAVVIAVGNTARLGRLASFVTATTDHSRVFELMGLYAHTHYREQLWVGRYRALCRDHGFERVMRVLMGGDGISSAGWPLASIVAATKRPHHWPRILDAFARQTYARKELIVVVHGAPDAVLPIPPELAESVRVIHAPSLVNLGFCLNEGIKEAKGDIWFKFDDDDYYGSHYIEDVINAYMYSGADVMGKPTYLVYIEGQDKTLCRPARERWKRRFYTRQPNDVPRMAGATLSARRDLTRLFSLRRRSGVDSEWTERMDRADKKLFFSDYFNFIFCRSADKHHHTWVVPDEQFIGSGRFIALGLARQMADSPDYDFGAPLPESRNTPS